MAPRRAVSSRKPSAAVEPEAMPVKRIDDLGMRTVTTSIRRDLWREIQKVAADQDCSLQAVMNRAVYQYLLAQNYTITVPPE